MDQNLLSFNKNESGIDLSLYSNNKNPWVKFITGELNKKLIFITSIKFIHKKNNNIGNNPAVEISLAVETSLKIQKCLNIYGTAEISTEQLDREAFWNDSLYNIFTGPNDPDLAVLIVTPVKYKIFNMKNTDFKSNIYNKKIVCRA